MNAPGLAEQAQEFVDEVNATLAAVFGDDDERLTVSAVGDKFVVATTEPAGIPLYANRRRLLRLHVDIDCVLDEHGTYLAVERSEYHVFGPSREALFRYEYLRKTSDSVPAAHLHVHAHRDALTQTLVAEGVRTPRARARTPYADSVAQMQDLHFPLGGARFRLALEDLLQMLVEEFGIDAADGWRPRIQAARQEWRLKQVKTVVRDAPLVAAQALRELGHCQCESVPPDSVRPGLLRF